MSKEKFVITQLTNRKPISINNLEQKDDGIFLNYHETIISQILEARENREFEIICAEIQRFIEQQNIDVCFVINKNELIDCLQEHQKLKLQIADLEAKLAEKDAELNRYAELFGMKDKDFYVVEKGEYDKMKQGAKDIVNQLKQQLAEKEKEIADAIILKPDKYVIVTNGWKKQGYGIARVHQEVRDIYYYCSNNRIGSFSPLTQYGEFRTLEEAESKLKELKKKRC